MIEIRLTPQQIAQADADEILRLLGYTPVAHVTANNNTGVQYISQELDGYYHIFNSRGPSRVGFGHATRMKDFVAAVKHMLKYTVGQQPVDGGTVVVEIPVDTGVGEHERPEGKREGVIIRGEHARLVEALKVYLESLGHKVSGLRLNNRWRADLYDHTTNTLYEVKGSSSHSEVLDVLSGLLHYSRYLSKPTLMGVFPAELAADDAELLLMYGIGYMVDGGRSWYTYTSV